MVEEGLGLPQRLRHVLVQIAAVALNLLNFLNLPQPHFPKYIALPTKSNEIFWTF